MDTNQALKAHAGGEAHAAARLAPLVYAQLRKLAARYLRHERPGHSLCPTDLVHEAYLRLVDPDRINWQGKTHFMSLAARQMRRILVESARAHKAQKRGGGGRRVTLADDLAQVPGSSFDVLALNEAIENLGNLSPRQAEVVELRFFGGLTVSEIAYILDVSERTVKGDWRVARAWLLRELDRRAGH